MVSHLFVAASCTEIVTAFLLFVQLRSFVNKILTFWKKNKNKIMPFAATWMDLEIVIRSEVSERKTNII